MALVSESFAIGPGTGALTLHTGRSGFGATVGHDLVIEATRWTGSVHIDAARLEASTVEVVVDATSLEVREGRGGVVPLLAINKSDIARNIEKVLTVKQHPEIKFRSTAVTSSDEGFTVDGELTIAGVSRSLALSVSADLTEVQPRGLVTAEVVQSDFGIKPYSAMFGALKVRDAVEIRAEVRVPAPSS